MGWTDPSEPEFFNISAHVGSLCLIAVNEYLPSFPTANGTGPAIRAELAVVDGPGAGTRYPDAMFFGKKIVPQLKGSLGSTILGRIGQGEKQAGKNAPYIVEKAGPGDAAKANAYVAAHGDVTSQPVHRDVSMASPQGYAPDNGVPPAGQAEPSLPKPPPYPQPNAGAGTYTTVGAPQQGDEPPF